MTFKGCLKPKNGFFIRQPSRFLGFFFSWYSAIAFPVEKFDSTLHETRFLFPLSSSLCFLDVILLCNISLSGT